MKTYLLIGAGPGIGIATARRFAAAGFRVVLASRSGKRIGAEASSLRQTGAQTEVSAVDASDPESVAALIRRYADDLAVLHYNAGLLHYDSAGALQVRTLAHETIASLVAESMTNLVSALVAVKIAQEVMAPRGEGSVLLTGGGFGIEPNPAFIGLSVAKAGLRAAAKALFVPAKNDGIHIATVTVSTLVAAGSEKSREIADAFWRLHAQAKSDWAWEVIVK